MTTKISIPLSDTFPSLAPGLVDVAETDTADAAFAAVDDARTTTTKTTNAPTDETSGGETLHTNPDAERNLHIPDTIQLSGGKLGPLPLVIGVTGHRDLCDEDVPVLERHLEEIFHDLSTRYPHTPIVLITGLAEGADRLAARVALRCGIFVGATLPMPKDEYRRDFDTPESLLEFDALLHSVHRWFAMPLFSGHTLHQIQNSEDIRSLQYGLASAYMVRHCQILIALWDGLPSDATGGTAQTVGFQVSGISETFRNRLEATSLAPSGFLTPPETGPVYHIVTPRKRHKGALAGALEFRILYPQDGEHHETAIQSATFTQIYHHMEEYNRDILNMAKLPKLEAQCLQSAVYLLPDAVSDTLPPRLQVLRKRYAGADALAQHFQKLTMRMLHVLVVAVVLSVLIFEVGAKLAPDNGWLALAFPGELVAMYALWYATVLRGNWQDKHQDYRALAEGLRVEFFWHMAGVTASVADHYLRKQRGELDWIRVAVRNLAEKHTDMVGEKVPGGFDIMQEHWVENQAHYFNKSAHRDEGRLKRLERWVQVLVLSSPILATVVAIALILPTPVATFLHGHVAAHGSTSATNEGGHSTGGHNTDEGGDHTATATSTGHPPVTTSGTHGNDHAPITSPARIEATQADLQNQIAAKEATEKAEAAGEQHAIGYYVHKGLIILMVLLAGIAGAIHTYIQTRALPQHTKQYERMGTVFAFAKGLIRRYRAEGRDNEARQVVLELGRESLAENGDWVLTHRERPVEVPHAG